MYFGILYLQDKVGNPTTYYDRSHDVTSFDPSKPRCDRTERSLIWVEIHDRNKRHVVPMTVNHWYGRANRISKSIILTWNALDRVKPRISIREASSFWHTRNEARSLLGAVRPLFSCALQSFSAKFPQRKNFYFRINYTRIKRASIKKGSTPQFAREQKAIYLPRSVFLSMFFFFFLSNVAIESITSNWYRSGRKNRDSIVPRFRIRHERNTRILRRNFFFITLKALSVTFSAGNEAYFVATACTDMQRVPTRNC